MRQLRIAWGSLVLLLLVALAGGCADKADTATTGPFANKTLVMIVEGNVLPTKGPSSSVGLYGGYTQARGAVYDGVWESPDPRLAGTIEFTVNENTRPDRSSDMSGTAVVTNDRGTWKGEWTGVVPAGGSPPAYVLMKLAGTGEYAGLRGYVQGIPTSEVGVTGSDAAVGGTIYTGWIEEAK